MGFRFRKSFKIAPGVKFNLNKNSHSFTFGGKGMHYTVNSKGKRTKSFGIPGTGLYYTETEGGNAKGKEKGNEPMGRKASKDNSDGCLGFVVAIVLLALALVVYSLLWIPAIPLLIYFFMSKKYRENRIRNVSICSVVLATSLLVFAWLGNSPELESISAEWEKEKFNIGDVVEVEIDANPSDAEIENLELSENDIATLEYKDGKATITFTDAGKASLYFTANEEIKSDAVDITVVDPEEEARLKAEEEERIRQEEEAKAAEEERIRQEQAAAEAAEQERLAQEQAAQEQAAQEQAAIAQQNAEDPIVYITNTCSKYHNASCRTLKSKIEKHLSEVRGVYEPCGICHPPQ